MGGAGEGSEPTSGRSISKAPVGPPPSFLSSPNKSLAKAALGKSSALSTCI